MQIRIVDIVFFTEKAQKEVCYEPLGFVGELLVPLGVSVVVLGVGGLPLAQ